MTALLQASAAAAPDSGALHAPGGRSALLAIQANWQALLPELAMVAGGAVVLIALRRWATRRLTRPGELATGLDDLFLELVRHTGLSFLVFVTLWTAPALLTVPPRLRGPFHLLGELALLIALALWGNAVISWFTRRQLIRSGAQRRVAVTALTALSFAARMILILILLLLALSNLGINVTALLTTLGVAGVAVALALQSVLTDLIGALSIVLNKPFLVGETIQVGDFLGTVEYVGLRTTRIRNLPGEAVFLPNSYLLNNAIHNISRLRERRASLVVRVAFSTSLEQLEKIPGLIAQAVRAAPETRFDRAHLKTFGDWGYEYEVIWFALTADYTRYMDARQRVHLGILKRFQQEGIELGAPARGTVPSPAHADVIDAVGEVYGKNG